MSKRNELLNDINSSIDMIAESCRNVDNIDDASYVANCVHQWLDQLTSEIGAYEEEEE